MVSFDHLPAGDAHLLHEGRTTIGRERSNDVSTFFDEKTSSSHSEILYRNGQCAVTDLRSSNGTFLNDEDIGIGTTVPLRSGDVVRVGISSYLVHLIDPAQAAALWPAWQKAKK